MEKRFKKLGSTLLVVLLMIIVLLMVAGSIGTLTQMTVRSTNEDYWESQASYAARAGMNHALSLLSTNPNHGTDIPNTPMTGDPGLTYEVEILNNMAGPDRYAPDNETWVPAGTVWIYSVGRVRERTESGIAAFAALVAPQRPVFNHAAYVEESLRILNGAQVLEYDPSSITPTPGDDARIATNSTAANSVLVTDSTVEGEVLSGVGSNPGSAIQITNSTTGAARASEEAKVISEMVVPPGLPPTGPDVVVTAFAAENPIYIRPGTFNDLIAQVGATVKLQPLDPTNQTYYFTGDIVLRYAVLEIPTNLDNPVKIYVDGDVHMVDCVVNNDTGDPVKLQIYQTGASGGTPKTFHISSTTSPSATGASFIAAGANTNFVLDNRAVLQGALIGRNVTVDHSSVLYYDVRLRGVMADGQGEMTIISEVQPPQGEVTEAYNGSTTVGTSANPPAPPPPPPAPPGIPPNNAATTTGPAAVTTATDTTATPAVAGAVGTSTAGNAALTGGAAGTSGAGTSGAGTSGAGTSGAGTSGAGTSGTGTSGAGTSGTGTSGTGTSGTGTSGTGTSGTGTSGTGPGGVAPTLLLDSCPTTTGSQQCP